MEYSSDLEPYVEGSRIYGSKLPILAKSGIEFRDRYSGVIKHYLPAPYAYEPGDMMNSMDGAFTVNSINSKGLEISVLTPLDWLLDPNRNYPVYIDPSDEGYEIRPDASAGQDAFISDQSNERLNVGRDPAFWLTLESSTSYVRARGIIKFDISSIPLDKDIMEANLKLRFYSDAENDQSSFTVTAYRLTRSWVEGTGTTTAATTDGACWLYYDGSNSWSTTGGDYDSSVSASTDISSFATYSWNIVDIFKGWYTGSTENHGVILKGMSGADSVKYLYTSDHSNSNDRPVLEVVLMGQKGPRVLAGAPKKIEIPEDSKAVYYDLKKIFEDPNDDDLTYSIWLSGWSSGPFENENITISIEENDTLMLLPRENQFGIDTIVLNANDTYSDAMHIMTISILPINDPPVLKYISDRRGVQKNWLNFTIRATEDDLGQENTLKFGSNVTDTEGIGYGKYSTLTITKSEDNPLKAEVSFLPQNKHVGDFYLTFWVRDHLGAEDNTSIKFSIKNRNDQPEITGLLLTTNPNPEKVDNNKVTVSTFQDEMLNFTVIVDDPDLITPDGEILQFWTNITDDKFILDTETGNVSFTPANADVGYFHAGVYVKDYEGSEDFVDIKIKVRNENDLPEILGIQLNDSFFEPVDGEIELKGKFAAMEDEYLNFTIVASDIDLAVDSKEYLKYTTNRSLDFNFELDTHTGEVSFIPSQEHVGTYVVRLSVLDADSLDGDIDIDDFSITLKIVVKDSNDPPRAPQQFILTEGDEGELSVRAFVTPSDDPDGDFITCIWDFGDGTDPLEKISEEDKWRATHLYSKPGFYTVTLTLDDGRGGLTSISRTKTVGEIIDVPDDPDEPSSLGMQTKDTSTEVNSGLIFGVLAVVIIVVIFAWFMYIRTGKKYAKDEDEEEDIFDSDFGLSELLGLPGQPPQGMMGGMDPSGQMNQYMGYPLNRNAFYYPQPALAMMGQPGMPPMATTYGVQTGSGAVPPTNQQQLMLPPAQQAGNFCPQCGQPSIEYLIPDGSSFRCNSCGYQV
jgi:hypothetical protein